jgi:hypothetical protein
VAEEEVGAAAVLAAAVWPRAEVEAEAEAEAEVIHSVGVLDRLLPEHSAAAECERVPAISKPVAWLPIPLAVISQTGPADAAASGMSAAADGASVRGMGMGMGMATHTDTTATPMTMGMGMATHTDTTATPMTMGDAIWFDDEL